MSYDGRTFEVDLTKHIIKEYNDEGTVIRTKSMAQDEMGLSADEWITRLQAPAEEPAETVNQPDGLRSISGVGIHGDYNLEIRDGKVVINGDIAVHSSNPAFNQYMRGYKTAQIVNGEYEFRGDRGANLSLLGINVTNTAKDYAVRTAIYDDLITKKAGGTELSSIENQFIQEYMQFLNEKGLQRPQEEQSMSTVITSPTQNTTGRIRDNDMSFSYTLEPSTSNSNGFVLNYDPQYFVNGTGSSTNQAVRAFRNGLANARTSGADGRYSFRGISAGTYNILSHEVETSAGRLAAETAIYNELLDKQSQGTTLTVTEEFFMATYLNSLEEYGLQRNANGELEDIPDPQSNKSWLRRTWDRFMGND